MLVKFRYISRLRCNIMEGILDMKGNSYELIHIDISCVDNYEDLLYIYFFTPQFKYMNFIYSYFRLHLSRVYYEPI